VLRQFRDGGYEDDDEGNCATFNTQTQCVKCATLQQSFMGKDIKCIVKQYAKCAKFRAEWDAASRCYDLMLEPNYKPEFTSEMSVRNLKRSGMSMASYFWFLKVKEFTALFDYEPKILNISVHSVTDEFGQGQIRGCFIKPCNSLPLHTFRVITVWSDIIMCTDEKILTDLQRLREDEPKDTLAKLSTDNAKQYTEPL
jgi:hypothetical protein